MREKRKKNKTKIPLLNWGPFGLKICYICGLFIAFIFICAGPSVKKYLAAGVIIEKSSVLRKSADSPAITFCIQNPFGWKNNSGKLDVFNSWVDTYCDSPATVDAALKCLDEQSFNLTETINSNIYPSDTFDLFLNMDHVQWMEGVTASTEGNKNAQEEWYFQMCKCIFVSGKCHTLQSGYEMGDVGIWIGLHPRTYKIYLHDSSFFLQTYKPTNFPLINEKLEMEAAISTIFFSSIDHFKLNRESSVCEEDPNYNFQHCVGTSLARHIGCKLPWDKTTSEEFTVCSRVKDLKNYSVIYQDMYMHHLNKISTDTGCNKPCHYREYKLVKKYDTKLLSNDSNWDSIIHLFPNDEIMVEKELKSYSGLSLLADIGGSLGMFLGFSFLMLCDAAVAIMLRIKHYLHHS